MVVLENVIKGRRPLWLVFGLALLLRVIYILEIDQSPLFAHPAVDSETYTRQAMQLATGNWLGVGQGWHRLWTTPVPPLAHRWEGAFRAV